MCAQYIRVCVLLENTIIMCISVSRDGFSAGVGSVEMSGNSFLPEGFGVCVRPAESPSSGCGNLLLPGLHTSSSQGLSGRTSDLCEPSAAWPTFSTRIASHHTYTGSMG